MPSAGARSGDASVPRSEDDRLSPRRDASDRARCRGTGSRAPATAAAAKTAMPTQITLGAPPSLRMTTAGTAKVKPARDASRPSRALRVARSGSTTLTPVPGSSMRMTGVP